MLHTSLVLLTHFSHTILTSHITVLQSQGFQEHGPHTKGGCAVIEEQLYKNHL
jgi:hypothetical protein